MRLRAIMKAGILAAGFAAVVVPAQADAVHPQDRLYFAADALPADSSRRTATQPGAGSITVICMELESSSPYRLRVLPAEPANSRAALKRVSRRADSGPPRPPSRAGRAYPLRV